MFRYEPSDSPRLRSRERVYYVPFDLVFSHFDRDNVGREACRPARRRVAEQESKCQRIYH